MNRGAVLDRVRSRMEATDYPRLQILLILSLCGLAGFLTSVLLLSLEVDAMWLRYALAGLTAYAAFVALVRLWIAWKRGQFEPDVDLDVLSELSDLDLPRRMPALRDAGEAHAGEPWDLERAAGTPRHAGSAAGRATESGWFGWGFDVDDLWWLALAAAALLAGIIAIAYVVYIAPLLLAEVALDAALVSAVYHRLQRHESGHWSDAVLRRTWIPAVIVVLSLAAGGFALQQIAPDARSIGSVIEAFGR